MTCAKNLLKRWLSDLKRSEKVIQFAHDRIIGKLEKVVKNDKLVKNLREVLVKVDDLLGRVHTKKDEISMYADGLSTGIKNDIAFIRSIEFDNEKRLEKENTIYDWYFDEFVKLEDLL